MLSAESHALERQTQHVGVLLSTSVMYAWVTVVDDMLVTHASCGLFSLVVPNMLRNDVGKFLAIFIPMLIAFTAAFCALFPHQDASMRAGSFWSMLESLILFSLLGETLEAAGSDGSIYPSIVVTTYLAPDDHHPERWIVQVAYYVFYLGFILMMVVLLLNLLIAMMGST